MEDHRWTEHEIASFARDKKHFYFEPGLMIRGELIVREVRMKIQNIPFTTTDWNLMQQTEFKRET